MISAELDRDLIERALRFAKLSEIESAPQVESIFEDHQYVPVWEIPTASGQIAVNGFKHVRSNDVEGFKNLQRALRSWLKAIITGPDTGRLKVLSDAVEAFKLHSSQTAIIRLNLIKEGGKEIQEEIPIPLWGNPELSFDEELNLKLAVKPHVVGVHSAVSCATILLFSTGLKDKLAVCPAPLPRDKRTNLKATCGAFFIRTKQRWAACSEECYTLYRRSYVNKKVREYWKSHPRKKTEPVIKKGKSRRGKGVRKKGGRNGRARRKR